MCEDKNVMNIWQLEEYAKEHNGWKAGHFIAISEKGIFEFKWLDAYYGFIEMVQPKRDGFINTKTLRDFFGDEQKYVPTIGYDDE